MISARQGHIIVRHFQSYPPAGPYGHIRTDCHCPGPLLMSRQLSFRAYQTGIALVSTVILTVVSASAQDVIVDQFADEGEVAGKWTRWWGGAEQTYEFDATVDADKKAGSGSLKATIGFDIAAHGGDNQFSLQHYLDTAVDGTKFTKLVFDIRFDPTSPTRPLSGDFGNLEYGLIPGDYSQLYLGNATVSKTNGGEWIHVSAPIDPAAPKLDKIIGVTFKLWAGDTAGDTDLTPRRSIATWGDSLARGSGAGTETNTFPAVLGAYSGLLVSNGGVGGETSTQIRARQTAASNTWRSPTIIWAGRNNYDEHSTILADTAAMVANLATQGNTNRYLVLSLLNGSFESFEGRGGGGYELITNINAKLAAVYGAHYVDVRSYLVSLYDPALTNDVIDFVNDIPPTSLRSDEIHLNGAGYAAVAKYIFTNKLATLRGAWSDEADPAGNNRLTGNTVFWVDNIRLVADTSTQPLPPPTLSVRKPVPGLQLFASKPGAQYQRQNIRTTDPSYGWAGNSAPVTYSFTIADYPDGSGKGFQTQLFLVPGTGIPAFETSPDYNEPDVIFVDLQNNADGSAYASFRHKTDQPNGNAMIYGAGTLGGIGNPTALGTWSLTMKDTSATLTTPSGSSTNFTLPAGTVARFAGPLYAYFGVQPNSTANIGRSATFSRIQITGAGTPIDDRFTSGPLDPVTWQVVAEDAPGILPVPADTAYALTWTLPDAGYNLEAGPGLAPGLFIDVTARSGPIQIGTRKVALVSGANLPAANGGFFRLRQP